MNNKRIVVIFGNSLTLASIGTLLQDRDDLDVIQVDAELADALQRIQSSYPNIVLFDLATISPVTVFSLMGIQPYAIFIGINLVNATMLVLCGQHSKALTAQDLVDTIMTDFKPLLSERPC